MPRSAAPTPPAPTPPAIDAARLDELALAYAARFATSGGRLRLYLTRKLRMRGWAGDGEPGDAVAAAVARLVAAGYVDDAAYSSAKRDGLLRRGLGPGRIAAALGAAGVAAELRAAAAPDEAEAWAAALTFARRRRFGPYGAPADRAGANKQIAAMLRAGHRLALARRIVAAAGEEDLAGE